MLVNVIGQGLAVAHVVSGAILERLVHPAPCLLPHTEAAVLQRTGDILAGAAQIGQLKVVDAAGAITGDMGDDAPLHQLDQVAGQAVLDHMSALGPDHGSSGGSGGLDALHQFIKFRTAVPVGNGIHTGGQHGVDANQIDAVCRTISMDAGKIKCAVFHLYASL